MRSATSLAGATWLLAISLGAAGPVLAASDDKPSSSSPSSSSPSSPPSPSPSSDLADEGAQPTPGAGGDACIDENVKADLFAKRRLRGTRDRLFQQTNRHELMLQGGYYVSDLFDGTYVLGAAYAYHMTEDLAIEASGFYTRLESSGGPELERTFAVLGGQSRRELLFSADLVWTLAHAKMRIGGSIDHFDFYLAAGGGVVDSVLSSDIAGNGGFGLKFFLGRAVALRIDVRDYAYRQELLSQKLFVNDLTSTVGLSLYLPVGE